MKTLAFDTETTGFAYYDKNTNVYKQPYITQLSYVIYDSETKKIEETFNEYIKIPEHINIPEKVVEMTGITKEICNTHGIDIFDALDAFLEACSKSNILIAHNMQFDNKMVEIELERNNLSFIFTNKINYFTQIKKICTMSIGKPLCNIMTAGNFRKPFLKNPKLVELHQFLFGTIPENLHDASVDTIVCLRCYIKMVDGYDINDLDATEILHEEELEEPELEEHGIVGVYEGGSAVVFEWRDELNLWCIGYNKLQNQNANFDRNSQEFINKVKKDLPTLADWNEKAELIYYMMFSFLSEEEHYLFKQCDDFKNTRGQSHEQKALMQKRKYLQTRMSKWLSALKKKMKYPVSTQELEEQEEIEVFSNPIGIDPTPITHNSFAEIPVSMDFVVLKTDIQNRKILTPNQLVKLCSLTEFEKIEIILLYNKLCGELLCK